MFNNIKIFKLVLVHNIKSENNYMTDNINEAGHFASLTFLKSNLLLMKKNNKMSKYLLFMILLYILIHISRFQKKNSRCNYLDNNIILEYHLVEFLFAIKIENIKPSIY